MNILSSATTSSVLRKESTVRAGNAVDKELFLPWAKLRTSFHGMPEHRNNTDRFPYERSELNEQQG
jgi:hypothetical protein